MSLPDRFLTGFERLPGRLAALLPLPPERRDMTLERPELAAGEGTRGARRQPAEAQGPESRADESKHRMPQRGQRAADLTLASLAQHEHETGRVDAPIEASRADLRRRSAPVLELHTRRQMTQACVAHPPPRRHLVLAFAAERRVQQRVGKRTVVGEQDQTLRVQIEAADRIEPGQARREQIHHRATPGGVTNRREKPARFVDRPARMRRHTHASTIDRDRLLARIRAIPDLDHGAIHPDASGADPFLGSAARREARRSQQLLDALARHDDGANEW